MERQREESHRKAERTLENKRKIEEDRKLALASPSAFLKFLLSLRTEDEWLLLEDHDDIDYHVNQLFNLRDLSLPDRLNTIQQIEDNEIKRAYMESTWIKNEQWMLYGTCEKYYDIKGFRGTYGEGKFTFLIRNKQDNGFDPIDMLLFAWISDGKGFWFPGSLLPFTFETQRYDTGYSIEFFDLNGDRIKEECSPNHDKYGICIHNLEWHFVSWQKGVVSEMNTKFAAAFGMRPLPKISKLKVLSIHIPRDNSSISCTYSNDIQI